MSVLFCCCCCVIGCQCLYVLRNYCCVGRESEQREDSRRQNAQGRRGRRHAKSDLSISSYVNLDYLLPLSVEKREHVAKKKRAPDLFPNMKSDVYAHAPFFKRKQICGTVCAIGSRFSANHSNPASNVTYITSQFAVLLLIHTFLATEEARVIQKVSHRPIL